MSREFKITLVILLIIAFLGVLIFPLVSKEIRREGSIKEMIGEIFDVPLGFVVTAFLKSNDLFCFFRGGHMIEKCGISCGKSCVLPPKDINKSCKSSKDCVGYCVAQLPIPNIQIDQKTGRRVLPKEEPVVLNSCRMTKSSVNSLGTDLYITSYECPVSVNIIATCQNEKYSDGAILWLYEEGVVHLYQEPYGM